MPIAFAALYGVADRMRVGLPVTPTLEECGRTRLKGKYILDNRPERLKRLRGYPLPQDLGSALPK